MRDDIKMPKENFKSDNVVAFIKEKINTGVFPIYSRLPSENELCKMLGVSRVTIRKALSILKNEQLLESRQGSGYYVCSNQDNHLVLVILSTANTTFRFNEMYQGIQDYFSTTDFKPLLILSDDNSEKESNLIKEYYQNNFKNMIISPCSSVDNLSLYHSLLKSNSNLVFIDTKPDLLNCNYVTSCNFTGGYTATKHLIDMGHRRIVFCANKNIPNSNTVSERFNGYKFALEENGIEFDSKLVFENNFDSIKDFASNCVANCLDATGFFCCSDAFALAISNLISQQKKKIAVIGFDNLSFSKTSIPSISTIDQNFYEIGRSAAEILYQKIIHPNKCYFEARYIPVKFIERNSTLQFAPLVDSELSSKQPLI